MSLAGKRIFITGGSRGIGLAIALRAARDGASVAIAAKTADPNPKLPGTIFTAASEIEAAGGVALPIQCDIRDEGQIEAAINKTAETFGGIDITVRRNAFGRQVDSFESDLDFEGSPLHAVFIRAPWVEEVGSRVQVLSEVKTAQGAYAVAVRQGHLLATSFHPELTGDLRVHRYFFDQVCTGAIK